MLLAPVAFFADPVKTKFMGVWGRATCTFKLDFWRRPARKETNVGLHKRSKELTVLIYTYCA